MRRLVGPLLLLVIIGVLAGWRLVWPERTVTLRAEQLRAAPVVLVELGTTAIFGLPDRELIAMGVPVIKREGARSAFSRFVWISRDPEGRYHAFVPSDPLSGCKLGYSVEAKQFYDPCWGAVYDLSGKHLAGPGEAGLWSYPVEVTPTQVVVDLAGAPSNR